MTDLHERFRSEFDEVPVPDLWNHVERLAETETVTVRPERSRVLVALAAAVAALVLIGGPLLLLASMGQDDPVADTSTTVPGPQALAPVDPPWSETISTVTLVGDGGVVAIASNPDRVFWSPDGVEWFDADPDRQVRPPSASTVQSQFEDRMIVSANGRVAVRNAANNGVWIAAPNTGQWRFVGLPGGEAGERTERVLTLAANDTDVLVVTRGRSCRRIPKHRNRSRTSTSTECGSSTRTTAPQNAAHCNSRHQSGWRTRRSSLAGSMTNGS